LDRRPSSRFRAALDRTLWLPLRFRQLSRQQAIPPAAKGACTRRHSGEAYAPAGTLASALAAAYLALNCERYFPRAPSPIPGTVAFRLFPPAISCGGGNSLYVGAISLAAAHELSWTECRTARHSPLFNQPFLIAGLLGEQQRNDNSLTTP